jgi:outer membrane protein OmpA-like peptidoglycan-associated protein
MRTVLFLLLIPAVSFAQNFTTLKTTTEKALSAYNEGIREASAGAAAIAQGYFEKAVKADPKFIDAKLALADTYIDVRDFFKAEQYFEEALALDTAYAPVAFLFLGKVEWELNKFPECAAHIESYLNSGPRNERNKKIAQHLLVCSRFAAEAVQNPVPFDPQPVGKNINTGESEYFPSLTADGSTLIFTRRERGDENFYSSTYKENQWQTATPLEGVNTMQNEGAQAISPDGTWLVFTACNREGDGSQGSCDLYWSQLKSTGWTKPVPFSSTINSALWEAQPTIGADNKTLIFSRGNGGPNSPISLWQTTRQNGGKWAKPEKLPTQINVGGKAHTPFLHPDGQTLYFSSDSLPGMGGSDIFFVRRQPDGAWGTPENIGYPINTKGEEGMMVVSLDGRTAYYASDRKGGTGGIDIYSFELPERARPRPVTYARARVVDATTGYPLVSKVDFIDLKTGQSYVATNTKSDGTALVCLPAGRDYALNVNKDNYLFFSDNFNLTGVATFEQPFILNIELQPIAKDSLSGKITTEGKPIVLRNVFFETGSASLRPESAAELDRLAALLTQLPTLRIQINGHTDNVGNDATNQTLSEQRAKAVQDYLIEKTIDPARLKFKGYGETKPMETNETTEGKARNRRTEFEVW